MNPTGRARNLVPLPRLSIEADALPLPASALRALAEVRVQQRLSMPTQCELTFADPPGPLTGVAQLTPGVSLRVTVADHTEPLFVGEVTAVEHVYEPGHGREIRVRGYDRLHRLRKRQPVRAHIQVTLPDLAQELVADLGLTVEAAQTGPQWPRRIQYRQSDLDLLVDMAEECGLYLSIRGDTLYLLALWGVGNTLPLMLGETLLETRIEVNGDPACRSVSATGWSPLQVETHTGRATLPRVGRDVLVEVDPSAVGGSGERDLANQATLDDRHAEALAQAELDVRVAREVTLWGVAEGDPRLQPGTPIQVAGIDETLAGRYVLTAVTHTIDDQQGFVSELSTVPPALRPRSSSAVTTLGIVTRVDDGDGLGRVKVSLPTFGDIETEWMGVLTVGAGHGKGIVALPDVGDTVLVLLTHEDPGQGIILGGLYGANGAPDSGVEGGAVRRYTLLTPGGQRIRLDDARRAIRLEDSQGNFVDMSPDRLSIHAVVDLLLDAPGQAVTIRGKTIDFQQA